MPASGFVQRPQFFLGTPAIGDVANSARDEGAILGLERAQTDFDGKFGTVLAQSIELQAGAHRTHLRVGEVASSMLRVLVAEPCGHQYLDRIAEQLGARVSEELFRLRVDQRDTAVLADYHHRV